jgi:hypothetical protein
MAIALLAEAFRLRELTAATIRIYDKALEKVPVPVLEPMTQRAIATRQFFPKVAELLQDAEACRHELLNSLKYDPCAQCNETGWETRLEDGVSRVHRCGCWTRHQQKVSALGVGSAVLALPSGETE